MPIYNPIPGSSVTGLRNVSDYGAVPARIVQDAVTNGTTTVTSATAAFSSADVGKTFYLSGAGLAGVGDPGAAGTACTITNVGSGYTPGNYSLGFSGGGGSGAAGTYTIGGGGTVTTTRMTNCGSGYTSAPTVSFPSGGGSGAAGTANIFRNVLTGTISSVTNSTTVVLSTAANGTSTALTLAIGADVTDAIQDALDDAGAAKGGVVLVNPGIYFVAGHLDVPNNVHLKGAVDAPLSLVGGLPYAGGAQGSSGSGGSFNQFPPQVGPFEGFTGLWMTDSASAYGVLVQNNSCVSSMYLYWPLQDATDFTPTAYPPAFEMYGANPSVKNVAFLNAYKAFYMETVNRPYVGDVYGQVLDTVVEIQGLTDGGAIERIVLAPVWGFFWGGASAYTRANLYCFKIYRCDGVHISDCSFFWSYVGFLLQTGSIGTINGTNYNGNSIGSAVNVIIDTADFGVVIYDINSSVGWSFTNCKFGVASHGVVDVSAAAHGPSTFTSCQFWGGYDTTFNYVCQVDGTANYKFIGCDASQYALSPFVIAGSARLTVTGCDLQTSIANDVTASAAASAIFVGNYVKGTYASSNTGTGTISAANNINY